MLLLLLIIRISSIFFEMISLLCVHEILARISSCVCIYTYATNKGRFEGKHCKILPEGLSRTSNMLLEGSGQYCLNKGTLLIQKGLFTVTTLKPNQYLFY